MSDSVRQKRRYPEKDGQKLEIRWLTYPSRQELPLLAESAQATLKEIGMDVQVNCTTDNNTIRKDPTLWDVYASAMVTAPTGDPEYFFTSCTLDESESPDLNAYLHQILASSVFPDLPVYHCDNVRYCLQIHPVCRK